MGTPPNTILGTDTVQAALKTKARGNDEDVYSKLDPANAVGAYIDLPTRLSAMDTLIANAGTGTAYVIASATEPSSPADGLIWIDLSQDPPIAKFYDTTNTAWRTLTDIALTQTLTNKTLTSPTLTSPVLNTGVSGTAVLDEDDMASDSATQLTTQQSQKAYIDTQDQSLVNAAPIQLTNWQTDPDQYTVEEQSMADPDGNGEDLLYKYVFPAGTFAAMYCSVLVPITGYNWQVVFPYRMSTSAAGTVIWTIYYRAVATGESYPEITDWTGWAAVDDGYDSITDTPSSTANNRNLISGTDLQIPSAAVPSQYMTLQLALVRSGGTDTHTGDAEVSDCIILLPVLA